MPSPLESSMGESSSRSISSPGGIFLALQLNSRWAILPQSHDSREVTHEIPEDSRICDGDCHFRRDVYSSGEGRRFLRIFPLQPEPPRLLARIRAVRAGVAAAQLSTGMESQ